MAKAKKAKKATKKRCANTKTVKGRVVPAKGYKWPGGGRCPVKAKSATKSKRKK